MNNVALSQPAAESLGTATPTVTAAAVAIMQQFVSMYRGQPIPLHKLRQESYSLSYLEQIFRRLRNNGLVKSIRGPGGGYCPQTENMSVGHVVRAMQCEGFLRRADVLNALDTVPLLDGSDSND
ncbi:Rrf2 family transcriptional regulator [Mixta calida]|uniref:Rrf2 family transcriptional regulator n=1 Tax=Mixta calida TaxID=665913 RepID=UPI0034D5A855